MARAAAWPTRTVESGLTRYLSNPTVPMLRLLREGAEATKSRVGAIDSPAPVH
jgi:hypothetical protein